MSGHGLRPLGHVRLVQLQPNGLITNMPEPADVEYVYDASRRLVVDRLRISRRGVEAERSDGSTVLDIHHLDHPDKEYDDDDLVCVGFSAHYDAMRREYGGHMTDGVAGENILVDFPKEVWLDDLGGTIVIENQDTGVLTTLEMVRFTAPCAEFSRFCLGRPYENVSKPELAAALRFLGKGRRGFLLLLAKSSGSVTVRPGDNVFAGPRT